MFMVAKRNQKADSSLVRSRQAIVMVSALCKRRPTAGLQMLCSFFFPVIPLSTEFCTRFFSVETSAIGLKL